MAVATTCLKLQAELDKAKGVRNAQRLFSAERKAAGQKVDALQERYKACKKANTQRAGLLYGKGLARALHDAGVDFPLKPGFEKEAGLGKADNALRKALRVDRNKDLVAAGKKVAKKHDLDEAAQHAATLYALQDATKAAQAGFISAQVAAAVLDVVASIFTWGGYAAAAPFVHGAIGAGQKVSMDALKKDVTLNEAKYQNALKKRQTKIDHAAALAEAKAVTEETKATEAAAAARLQVARQQQAQQAAAPLVSPYALGGAVLLVAVAAGYTWSRNRRRT